MRRVACLVALAASLCLPASGVAASDTPAWLALAAKQLPQLKVKAAAPMTGYSREKFGSAWADVDDNGCDTRNDILKRDLKQIVFRSGNCVVKTGTLHDPYTGKTIHVLRGVKTSVAVQIDHVVALAAAWRAGAATWATARRRAYANDRTVLLAVDGPANESKGDSDASEWLPPRSSYDCRYVARQIAIKRKYGLSVTPAERDRMAGVIAGC
jgi:hypothetical protein